MSLKCIKCSGKFSSKELKEFEIQSEYDQPRYIYDECFLIEEDNTIEQDTFDSDSGL